MEGVIAGRLSVAMNAGGAKSRSSPSSFPSALGHLGYRFHARLGQSG